MNAMEVHQFSWPLIISQPIYTPVCQHRRDIKCTEAEDDTHSFCPVCVRLPLIAEANQTPILAYPLFHRNISPFVLRWMQVH